MVFLQDAIDLVHGQFIVSVSRGSSSQPQKGGLEAFAVSESYEIIVKIVKLRLCLVWSFQCSFLR